MKQLRFHNVKVITDTNFFANDMKKGKVRLIILITLFVIATIVLTIIFWPFIKDLRNNEYREAFSLWIKSLGFKGVLILLGVQVLQIVAAVIPGGPVQIIAGAAYGALGGLAIMVAGCVFASSFIFFLIRKFGLPLLRRFFGENDINTWVFLKDTQKVARVVFILFLIPGTPKDLLTWLCPLTNLSLPMFLVVSIFARIPGILSSTIMGDSMIQGNWILSLSIVLVIAITGLFGLWFKDRIANKLKLFNIN
jgi:uncharacterized membrane protein YdjX (TVP38/TMEM64 family)